MRRAEAAALALANASSEDDAAYAVARRRLRKAIVLVALRSVVRGGR